MSTKEKCCEINTMCGLSLRKGVIFVGGASSVISFTVLIMCIAWLLKMPREEGRYNRQPVLATNMIFVFCSTSFSMYQIAISLLLVWQVLMRKGGKCICSLWYVSHLSVMTLYCFLFTARSIVAFNARHYVTVSITIVAGVIYKAIFTYFCIVVNSYLRSLEFETYF